MSDIQPSSAVSIFNLAADELATLEANSVQQLIPEVGEVYRLMMAGTEGLVLADHFVVIRSGNDLIIRFTDNREIVFSNYFEVCVVPPAEDSDEESTLQCSVDVAGDGGEGVSIGSGAQSNYELAAGESLRIVYAHGSEQAIASILGSQPEWVDLYAAYILASASPALAAAAFSPALLGVGAGTLALAGGGGGGGGTPAPTGPTAEETALTKVKDYAEDVSKPTPTLDDYKNIGVTGVNADNLTTINSAIDAQGGADNNPGNSDDSTSVDSAEKLQKIINAYNAILEVADGTENNADDPTQGTYEAIGVTGIDHENELSLLGEVLDGKTKEDVDSISKLQTLANAVQNVMSAAAGTKGVPSQAELEALGIEGVTPENLAAIQKALQNSTDDGSGVASVESLQNQVNIGIGNALSALEKIANYAHDSSDNPAPSLEDYENAGVNGVTQSNLAAVNEIIDAATKPEADTTGEVQALVDGAANKLAALAIIADYAESNTNDVPTLQHYLDADIDGVNASNLAYVNTLVDAEEREGADTEAEVEALINTNKVAITAMEKIANYADSMSNPTPTLEDYTNAGITHALLTEATLAAVNELVEAQEREGADTPEEVLALLNDAGNKTTLDAIQKYNQQHHGKDRQLRP